MSKMRHSVLFVLVLCLVLSACDSGPKPVEITGLTNYTDELIKFSIEYPENWVTTRQPGERFVVFSSNDAKPRFIKYDSEGFPGAMIDVYATKVDETKTEDFLIQRAQIFSPEIYEESEITVDGVQGRRFDYTFPLQDGDFRGVIIIASKDQITYTILKLESFGGTFGGAKTVHKDLGLVSKAKNSEGEPHAAAKLKIAYVDSTQRKLYEDNFNQIIATLKLAETPQRRNDTLTIIEELPFPSENLVQKQGNGFSISVPDNFYLGKTNSANMIASYNYIGDRRGDCNIQVDVLDGSQTSDFKKAATELASRYPNSPSVSGVKIGGTDGYVMNWRPTKDVRGRVYFAKKGDKIFRISLNWFAPEETNYLPIFEKSIASIKFD